MRKVSTDILARVDDLSTRNWPIKNQSATRAIIPAITSARTWPHCGHCSGEKAFSQMLLGLRSALLPLSSVASLWSFLGDGVVIFLESRSWYSGWDCCSALSHGAELIHASRVFSDFGTAKSSSVYKTSNFIV